MSAPSIPEWYPAFLADLARDPANSFKDVVARAFRWGQRDGVRRAIGTAGVVLSECSGDGVAEDSLDEVLYRLNILSEEIGR